MIQPFSFSNPVTIHFGEHAIAKISQSIPQKARVLLVYGGGSIHKNGVYAQVKKALEGFQVFEYSGIGANPELESCLPALELIQKERIDFILAVGGGSVIDASKFLALATFADSDPWEILSKAKYPTRALPFGTVLTLPATGTEMNDRSVISKAETQEKLAFRTPLVYPQFSVLDPTLTYSLPIRQVANGVVDTFVHTTEQYLTVVASTDIQDRFAEGILQVLVQYGPQALETPESYDVRANLMWASTWALNGWIGQGVVEDWATHSIGHELTALHGIDHARTLAIVLPGVLRFSLEAKKAKILQMGERVFGIQNGTENERVEASLQALESFFQRMGLPTRLSDYGLDATIIPPIVKRFEARKWKLGEQGRIDAKAIETILTARV